MLRKRGKYWHIQLKVNGKPWSRSTGETDRNKARKVESKILAEAQLLREQPHGLPSLDQAVVQEIARIESDVSTQAAERARYYFESFQKWLGRDTPLTRIDSAMLERFQRDRLKKASQATVNHELTWIVRMLRGHGLTARKPKSRPGKVTEQRDFSDDELRRFFAHCDPKQKTLFQFLLVTGARPAEAIPSARSGHVALLKSEVDSEKGLVTIRSAKVRHGRRGTVRVVPVPEELMEELVQLGRETPGPHVFPPMINLFRTFDRIIKKAGIAKLDELKRKVTAHSFRHTYATLAAQMVGGNPFLVKQILGHTQITTTDRYCHVQAPAIVIDLAALDGKDGCQSNKRTEEVAS